MSGLFIHCRHQFETETAQELQSKLQDLGEKASAQCQLYAGFITCEVPDDIDVQQQIDFRRLIFSRQWFSVLVHLSELDTKDRVSAIISSLAAHHQRYDEVFIETPDTNQTKVLSRLCRGIEKPLLNALQKAGKMQRHSPLRLHICFTATNEVYLGWSMRDNSATWPMGIPRLKFPQDAPSRSTLKLEEAILVLMDYKQRAAAFEPGRRAVDLGAAPGGWTYQLVKRGLLVMAVDNGKMDPVLMATEMVEHQRADGFTYRPQRPVDWMVCDIVDKPNRVAELVAKWFVNGWCQHCIFNLKLPMKKRFEEVQKCFSIIGKQLGEKKINFSIVAKQLYHDRDEITCYLRSVTKKH